MPALSSNEIRRLFLDYFEKQGHKVIASSSLVPHLDPTLLFTNAGMNQFKGVFTGEESRPYSRAATSQKCVRAGGKHNDLENVGYTARHHTFFEMLGNFSFGDYFKKEAIEHAWAFITKVIKLPVDKLHVTVFREDDEAYNIWHKDIGLSADRITRLDEKDNFWAMGATGPCGPCSEIYYDQGPSLPGEKVGDDGERYLEFWNLVFMEFEQKQDGSRVKLPKPSIDTGMGLERVSSILQGKLNNYDSDVFEPLISAITHRLGERTFTSLTDAQKVSCRVIADHVRAMTFLISDGVFPSKDGRGYVLRRIMRRAIRHGRKLGFENLFLAELSAVLVNQMGTHYKELVSQAKEVQQIISQEETQFSVTVDRGIALLSEEISRLQKMKSTELKGDIAFHLYDTYGFPVDMTADMLRENGLSLDQVGFDAAFENHREKARGSWKGSQSSKLDEVLVGYAQSGIQSNFLGYDTLTSHGKILKMIVNGVEVDAAFAGDEVELIADRTPFYGESGGQVGDIGSITSDHSTFSLEVLDTKKPSEKIYLHKCKVLEGTIKVGSEAIFSVDPLARSATAKNHTSTHLLHSTLIEILGSHVRQKGSLVSPERLRFDFAHPKPISAPELSWIEKTMNERIWLNSSVTKKVMPLEEAMKSGATALFDEKYGNEVRVVSVDDYSKELCGGTHLTRTGEIGIFKIIKESSVASGVRRIEALTGYKALRLIEDQDKSLKQLAAHLGVSTDLIETRVEALIKQQKESKKQLSQKAAASSDLLIEDIGKVKMISLITQETEIPQLRILADQELNKHKSGIVVLGSNNQSKAVLIVKISKDLCEQFNASVFVQQAAKMLEGSGGGKPEMAQAGGTKPEKIKDAISMIRQSIQAG